MLTALAHERRIQLLAILGLLPFAMLTGVLLSTNTWPIYAKVALSLGLLAWTLWVSKALMLNVRRPLQTLLNVLSAIRHGDYAFRVRTHSSLTEDALEALGHEMNALSELLLTQRTLAMEATALLDRVMLEMDVAIFIFDEQQKLRLINRAGRSLVSTLLGAKNPMTTENGLGWTAEDLGLVSCLETPGVRMQTLELPNNSARLDIRSQRFRQEGREHHLLILSDITRNLREEERLAWQRLIRVMGHEINNSLSPIQSLSDSLQKLITQQHEDWQDDTRQGLAIIKSRAQALGRFMESYTRLARLEDPKTQQVKAGELCRKLAALEQRRPIHIPDAPELHFMADPDQLEQALINLLCNAVEAMQDEPGMIHLSYCAEVDQILFCVEDEGPGLPQSGNLFVPFFTTKPKGSGIGLVLSRQIAEKHGGSLHLENRSPKGARALLRLPLKS